MSEQSENNLSSKTCRPCEGGTMPLNEQEVEIFLKGVPEWEVMDGELTKIFTFKNFYMTMAFVNALAWVAHTEDHHPNLEVSYKTCRVRYVTHSIKGLSENDFICAAKINDLVSFSGQAL